MSHLNDSGCNYFQHLFRSWRWAFILIVHGLFPFIWQTKASDEICKDKNKRARAYLLEKQYGIVEHD